MHGVGQIMNSSADHRRAAVGNAAIDELVDQGKFLSQQRHPLDISWRRRGDAVESTVGIRTWVKMTIVIWTPSANTSRSPIQRHYERGRERSHFTDFAGCVRRSLRLVLGGMRWCRAVVAPLQWAGR